MTIDEAREAKAKAEADIRAILTNFMKATGAHVDGLDVRIWTQSISIENKRFTAIAEVSIRSSL